MHKLGQNLKHLLKQANLSESELARRTGVPQQIINRILSGQNLNPKLATLTPLAGYFSISISQLIGDETFLPHVTKLSVKHSGWSEAPLIEWKKLGKDSLEALIAESKTKITTDVSSSEYIFATKICDTSMEPKFSEKSILIFDSSKPITDKDFVIIYLHSEQELVLRQVYIKDNKIYKKCFNPRFKDYKLTLVVPGSIYIGVLIQSRTDYLAH